MTKRMLAIVLVAALAAAGCSSAGRAPESPAQSTAADYDLLWQAAVDVVGSRFPISRAERESGLIETAYLIGPFSKTGFKSNLASGEAAGVAVFHTVRRRAVVKVSRSPESPLEVRVGTARLVRERPDIVRGGTFGGWEDIDEQLMRYPSRWRDNGRDEALEARIAGEIEKRYLALTR